MPYISRPVDDVAGHFTALFTRPTFKRLELLVLAAILISGRRTVVKMVVLLGNFASGSLSTWCRVFSRRRWPQLRLSKALVQLVVTRFVAAGVVDLVGDDTVTSRPGKHVYGKARHRDGVKSSHSFTAFHYGHRWVVLSILVKLPGTARKWALPVLFALYRSPEWNKLHHCRHKTPPELMEGLLALALRTLPDRTLRFAGDGAFATHRLGRFAQRHRGRLSLVSRFYGDAQLFELPPQHSGKPGRPRTKGQRSPMPAEVVAQSKAKRSTVSWYGGGRRLVALVTGTGYWSRRCDGFISVRWVHVADLTGTHRDEYFFTTDVALTADAIVEAYTGRWNIETTFQEAKEWLGFGATRAWTKQAVLREDPLLLAVYSLVAVLFAALRPNSRGTQDHASFITFSVALTAVRRHLWTDWIFKHLAKAEDVAKIPKPIRAMVVDALVRAA